MAIPANPSKVKFAKTIYNKIRYEENIRKRNNWLNDQHEMIFDKLHDEEAKFEKIRNKPKARPSTTKQSQYDKELKRLEVRNKKNLEMALANRKKEEEELCFTPKTNRALNSQKSLGNFFERQNNHLKQKAKNVANIINKDLYCSFKPTINNKSGKMIDNKRTAKKAEANYGLSRYDSAATLKNSQVGKHQRVNSFTHPMENNSYAHEIGNARTAKKQHDPETINRLNHDSNKYEKELVTLPEGVEANVGQNVSWRHSMTVPQNVHESGNCRDREFMPRSHVMVNRVMIEGEVPSFSLH